MRSRILGVACLACVVTVAAHAAPPDPVLAPINKFLDSFNAGDMKAAEATHAGIAHLTIIDEVPPFVWYGPTAFRAWSTDLGKDSTKNGITDQVVTLGTPTRIENDGEHAYVVAPAVYTFKQRGTPMRESAQMTFVLRKNASGWLIHGWTWTGPRPEAVKP
jgi:ketosteroid isomerase-like protein